MDRRLRKLYNALEARVEEDTLYEICKGLVSQGFPAQELSTFLRSYINSSLKHSDYYKLDILGVMEDLHGLCAPDFSLKTNSFSTKSSMFLAPGF